MVSDEVGHCGWAVLVKELPVGYAKENGVTEEELIEAQHPPRLLRRLARHRVLLPMVTTVRR
ncbi:hypothetical protein ABZ403_15955 [Micromonospora zamorensis]|uniref:hypothetical protein n=1 Tax=Micromonospora zamorensis TaxID=709883 RepID=UPI0033DFC19A